MIESISAITLATHDMARSVAFYAALGFALKDGGAAASFTSFRAGTGYLNVTLAPDRTWSWWGRAIFFVDDVDAMFARALAAGLSRLSLRATLPGASDISTSSTRTAMN